MAKQSVLQDVYVAGIYDDPGYQGALRFTFGPKHAGKRRLNAMAQNPSAQYIVTAKAGPEEVDFEWVRPPSDPELREELEAVARQRMTTRDEWLQKLRKLVATVKGWADELDWATRSVEKKMDDPEIGNYTAPALLLQKEAVRLFLEPVARTAPGTEGLVELYLMPSYDDIAGLYFYNGRWNLHYDFNGAPTAKRGREAEAKPLTKATLRKVLGEMQAHAG